MKNPLNCNTSFPNLKTNFIRTEVHSVVQKYDVLSQVKKQCDFLGLSVEPSQFLLAMCGCTTKKEKEKEGSLDKESFPSIQNET